VNSGGTQYVLGGTLYVPIGGTTIGTRLSGGTEFVFFGGTANSTVVGDGGNEYVYLNATASGTIVSSGGYEYVSGTASGTIVTGGGETIVSGTAIDTVVTGGEEYVRSGGTASGTDVTGGYEYVCSKGTDSGTVVSSGGYEYVSGTAFDTTVNNGAVEVVYAGGTASGTTVENGGTLIVDAGGTAVDITVSNGAAVLMASAVVLAGQTSAGVILESGDTETVLFGGTAIGTTVSSGGIEVVSAGGTAEGIVISAGGTAVLRSGAVTGGGIVLADFGARLEIDGTVMPGATISGLLAATTIDLANETYSLGGQASLVGNNVLQITGIGATTIDLQLDVNQDYADTSFSLAPDGSEGTDIITATTYTWIGGYDGSYSASVPQNWSPTGGPQAGDIIIVPAGSTLDVPSGGVIADTTIDVSGPSTTVTYTGVTASGNTVTLGSGVVWNIASSSITSDVDSFAGNDTLNLNNSSVATSILTFGTGGTLDLTGSTAGSMVIDPDGGGAQTIISQTGSGASLLIKASGAVTNNGMVWVNSTGGTTTLNIQPNGSNPGTYDSENAMLVTGGTLVVKSTANSSVFANDGFVLDWGGTHASLVQITAPMATSNGQFMLVGGTDGATLELKTHTGGGQMVVFGDDDATLRIDASTILSYQNNTSVLANTKAHILDFQPGDTIDLAGLAPANLTYSYDTDTTYGSDVLELMNNGTLIGLLRFSNGVYAAGTGDVATGSFSSNFVLSSDAAGTGTKITLQTATLGSGGTVDGSIATWAAMASGGTADWSTGLWTGGEGSGGVPGQYQAAQITFTQAELNILNPGDIGTEEGAEQFLVTVTSAETAGSLVFDNPFATMEIGAALTLATQAGESGGGFTQANGTVVIGTGGTLTAERFLQVSGDFSLEAGGSIALSGQLPFAANIGLQGFEIESQGTISDGTLTALGATQIGEQDPASLQVDSGASVTDTYTMIGGETFADTMGGTSSLSISGPDTQWTDAGGDGSTPYSGAILVGGGYPGVSGTFVTSVSNGGAGDLSVDDDATLTDASYAILGVTSAAVGNATVSNGALWQIGTGSAPRPSGITIGTSPIYNTQAGGSTIPALMVGLGGSGSLDIQSGGTVQLGTVEAPNTFMMAIGEGGPTNTGASGTVNVDGTKALLDTGGGAVVIGMFGTGVLSVNNGGTVLVGDGASGGSGMSWGAVLGYQNTTTADSSGTLTVGGSPSAQSLFAVQSGDLVIGDNGSGVVNIQNNASLSVAAGTIYLGGTSGGNPGTGPGGALNVSGGQVEATGLWIVNNPVLTQSSSIAIDGGTVSLAASSGLSATFNMDSGSAVISGGGMLSLDASGTAEIGNAALTIDNNGTLQFAAGYTGSGYQLTIGNGSMSGPASTVTVQNNGWLDASGPISIGQSNSGTLTVGANASVIDGKVGSGEPWSAVVGNESAGTLTVSGGNARFVASGAMVVGLNSFGALDVQQGGAVTVGGQLDVGGSPLSPSNGTGQVTIDGGGVVGSAWLSVAGDIVVGDGVTSTGFSGLTVANGGSLYAAGTAYLGDTMQSDTLVTSTEGGSLMLQCNAQAQLGGLAMWSGSSVSVDGSSTLLIGSTGIPAGAPGDILIGSDGVLSGGGTIGGTGAIIDDGLIEASVPGSTNLLHIMGPISGGGTLDIGAGATLEVGSVANTDSIVFGSGPPGTLMLTAAMLPFPVQASIQQFSPGDTIDLAGQPQSGVTLNWDQETAAGGVLSVTNGAITIANLDISGSYTPTSFSTQDDASGGTDIVTDTAPCFAAGTRVATTRGEVAVERLRVGDQVRLARGGTAPALWLGHRTVACARHPRPQDVMPVRVVADAFGSGQPGGDLLLSPDHAVFIDGVLIPIRYLLNGATVVQEAASRVTYWHVELDHHDVLLAEGLACESYLDTGNRGAFANGGGATMVHADFAIRVWERESCARLVWAGAELEAARSYLLDRAHELGFTITRDPELHLVVGGQSLWPTAVADGVHRFTLPAGAGAVVIASRSAIPGEMSDVYEDGRRLGVMLARITFRQRGKPIGVALDTLPDDAGFHALEVDDRWCWRWTDGHARVEVPPDIVPDAPFELELHVAAIRPTWLAPARQSDAPRADHKDGHEVVAAA
jgi:autotransporter passenger strand-loop-strand repeat protein/T5SS/PEP-CTERM-associated repeat protein